jgi:hypothetical protein
VTDDELFIEARRLRSLARAGDVAIADRLAEVERLVDAFVRSGRVMPRGELNRQRAARRDRSPLLHDLWCLLPFQHPAKCDQRPLLSSEQDELIAFIKAMDEQAGPSCETLDGRCT